MIRFLQSAVLSAALGVAAVCALSMTASGQQPTKIAPMPDQATSLTAEAEAAIVKSDWKTAQLKLNAWLATHPTDAHALFDAGYVADAQDHEEDAAGFYRRAVAADPKSFEAHLSLGLLLARQGKTDDARPELLTATTLNPGNLGAEMKARAWRAMAQIDQSIDSAAASSDLIEALKLSPETPADMLMTAALAEKTEQYETAAAAYRRLLAKEPKSVDVNAGLAHLLIVQKKYAEAETLLRDALIQSPDDPVLTAQLATVLVSEDKAEALPLIEKLHEAHPEDETISRMFAEVLATAGDFAGAEDVNKKLLMTKPNDVDLLLAHGRNLVALFQYAAAFKAYEQVTKIDPNNPDGWNGLAFTAERTHQPAISLQALDMRAKYLPENASSYYLRAIAHDKLNHTKDAIKYYHLYLDSPTGKSDDRVWQAKERLKILGK